MSFIFPPHAVLGRFLHSLNRFCLDQYGMEYDVGDYEEYNFAKVGSETSMPSATASAESIPPACREALHGAEWCKARPRCLCMHMQLCCQLHSSGGELRWGEVRLADAAQAAWQRHCYMQLGQALLGPQSMTPAAVG